MMEKSTGPVVLVFWDVKIKVIVDSSVFDVDNGLVIDILMGEAI